MPILQWRDPLCSIKKKKMKYKQLILLSIMVILFSCQIEKDTKLESNKTFSESETKEIINLLNQFDSEICKNENKENGNISICYQAFFQRIVKEIENGSYEIGINEASQKRIVETLSPELYKEFWKQGEGIINRRIPNSNETFSDSIQSLYIAKGKYFEFLENEVSKINPTTKQYFDKFITVGDISPSMVADVAKNYENYDIKDERIRFLIAIHYLTLNDQNLKSKASYDKLFKEVEKKSEE